MPGLVSTLLNQAYSTPSRLVHTFLQVTEQVWQPMHLSRFSTIAIWARIFMTVSSFGRDRARAVEPIDLRHLAQDDELVAVRADRAVVVEAVGKLGVAADHMRGLRTDPCHRVVDATALAGDLAARHVHDLLLGVIHHAHAGRHALADHGAGR